MNVLYFRVVILPIFLFTLNYAFADLNQHEGQVLPGQEPSSWVDKQLKNTCQEKLAPFFNNITISDEQFDSGSFCYQLQQGINNFCSDQLKMYCEKVPWKPLKFACLEYLTGFLCK